MLRSLVSTSDPRTNKACCRHSDCWQNFWRRHWLSGYPWAWHNHCNILSFGTIPSPCFKICPKAVFSSTSSCLCFFLTLSIGILKISCFYEESQGIPFTKLVLLHCSQSRIRGSMYTSSLSRITKTIFF